MRVAFYATLRSITGTKHVDFDLPEGATVHDLLRAAGNRYPRLEELLWNADGTLGDYIKVFVDGREIRHLALLETRVPPGANVDIFPPVAGG